MRHDSPRARTLLAILLAVCLALLVLDSRAGDNPVGVGARAAGAIAFGPLSSAVATVAEPLSSFYTTLTRAPGAARHIEDLERRNADLAAEVEALQADGVRSAELADLFTLSGLGGYEIVPAQAVTRATGQGYSQTITLDVGERDGVAADMTVINGEGLVGRVMDVTSRTSTVLLLTDSSASVGARMAGSKEIGVVSGSSHAITEDAPLNFELLDATATVKTGDRVVTLGSHDGAPFVPGVPVGKVRSVEDTPGALSRTALVTPFVDVSRLDVVGVVVAAPETDPRDSVLPDDPSKGDK
ncbi:rod shape-determining protein MreC [Nocardiopsis ansamitocini]|uniref:Cell shape-determining protein MreC n=1 Tax=Nocardiopsis ansamitocini TaxID=1670832 RepID=A0A9W6P6L9_9ACTN|nr:rod shape-determining protein MreC [Nocardiopsis ansamitocini]GLU47963.1 rod shape-determining protein MreC [Nocardiopsis ansamitocini]